MRGGDPKEYLHNLKLYLEEADEKKEKLEKFFQEGDLENYQIIAHAVKSTSKLVGANELSEMAQEMEKASAARDMEAVRSGHMQFMERFAYQSMCIADMLGEFGMEDPRKEFVAVSPEELRIYCERLRESLSEFDMEAIQSQVGHLQTMDVLKDIKDAMQTAVNNFDYDGMSEMVDALERLVS